MRPALSESTVRLRGLVLIPPGPAERVGHYALQAVGTLRAVWEEGANAQAGDASWRFAYKNARLRRNDVVVATDATGNMIGEYGYRGGILHWDGRVLELGRRRRWRWLPAFVSANYAVVERGRTVALLWGKAENQRPLNIAIDETAALEPGLLLFVAFVGRELVNHDNRDNDGGD